MKTNNRYPSFDELEAMMVASDLNGDRDGWCINCGEVTECDVDPDCADGFCSGCGQMTVFAPFELLIAGMYND